MDKPRKSLYLTYNNAEEGYLRDEYYINKIHVQNVTIKMWL